MTIAIRSVGILTVAAIAAAFAFSLTETVQADAHEDYEAVFNKDGELIRPAGWREWVFVGSPVTPNSLNGGAAPFPEFHSVYIDPKSWDHYKKTGEFREGTMFAKELTLVGDTSATSGIGFFNGKLQGFDHLQRTFDRTETRLAAPPLVISCRRRGDSDSICLPGAD